jgi:hypothetical protein
VVNVRDRAGKTKFSKEELEELDLDFEDEFDLDLSEDERQPALANQFENYDGMQNITDKQFYKEM